MTRKRSKELAQIYIQILLKIAEKRKAENQRELNCWSWRSWNSKINCLALCFGSKQVSCKEVIILKAAPKVRHQLRAIAIVLMGKSRTSAGHVQKEITVPGTKACRWNAQSEPTLLRRGTSIRLNVSLATPDTTVMNPAKTRKRAHAMLVFIVTVVLKFLIQMERWGGGVLAPLATIARKGPFPKHLALEEVSPTSHECQRASPVRPDITAISGPPCPWNARLATTARKTQLSRIKRLAPQGSSTIKLGPKSLRVAAHALPVSQRAFVLIKVYHWSYFACTLQARQCSLWQNNTASS